MGKGWRLPLQKQWNQFYVLLFKCIGTIRLSKKIKLSAKVSNQSFNRIVWQRLGPIWPICGISMRMLDDEISSCGKSPCILLYGTKGITLPQVFYRKYDNSPAKWFAHTWHDSHTHSFKEWYALEYSVYTLSH